MCSVAASSNSNVVWCYGSNWDIFVNEAVCHTHPTPRVRGEWCVSIEAGGTLVEHVSQLSVLGVGVGVGGGLSPLVTSIRQGGWVVDWGD
jgi:hypothetical protein